MGTTPNNNTKMLSKEENKEEEETGKYVVQVAKSSKGKDEEEKKEKKKKKKKSKKNKEKAPFNSKISDVRRIDINEPVQNQLVCLQDQYDSVQIEMNSLRRIVVMLGKYIQYDSGNSKGGYSQLKTLDEDAEYYDNDNNNDDETRINIKSKHASSGNTGE